MLVINYGKNRGKLELLEQRRCLANIGFMSHEVISPDTPAADIALAADLDADGDQDIVVGSNGDNKIAWYENLDGAGTFGSLRLISHASPAVRGMSVHVDDLDGDGDIDILYSPTLYKGGLYWFENIDGASEFHRHAILKDEYTEWATTSDLDGDGDGDIIASVGQGNVVWLPNLGAAEFDTAIAINTNGASQAIARDLDGDGDLDLVAAEGSRTSWYENTDGRGTFGPQIVIRHERTDDNPWLHVNTVTTGDFDVDGDLDIVVSTRHGGKIVLYENQGPAENFRRWTYSLRHSESVIADDIDNDGDADLVINTGSTLSWWRNGDDGFFEAFHDGFSNRLSRPITSGPAQHRWPSLGDLDGDGDLDVITAAKYESRVAWYEFSDGPGPVDFLPEKTVNSPVYRADTIYARDLDNDRDIDILAFSFADRQVSWFENAVGRGLFTERQAISGPEQAVLGVAPADLDGDGDVDLFAALENSLGWYEWTQDEFVFREGLATDSATRRFLVNLDDIDGDGDTDILLGSMYEDERKLVWFQNTDGQGTLGTPRLIQTESQVPAQGVGSGLHVSTADLDNDGDLDIISWSENLSWYENIDGMGRFSESKEIREWDSLWISSLNSADVDGDGHDDMMVTVVGRFSDGTISWFQNVTDARILGEQKPIAGGLPVTFAAAVDMDGDGDLDVVSASSYGTYGEDSLIAWHENLDGQGSYGPNRSISVLEPWARWVGTADIDGDGDLDVISNTGERITWHENRNVGDVNNDSVFDSSDLVRVFQAGKYEDEIPTNASFEEGDWNGDGEFDSSDLVFAFQSGAFTNLASVRGVAQSVDSVYAPDEHASFRHRDRSFILEKNPEGTNYETATRQEMDWIGNLRTTLLSCWHFVCRS